MKIKTVGELRELLRYSEDDEPIYFQLKTLCGYRYFDCSGAGSSAGGRVTILWLDPQEPQGTQKEEKPSFWSVFIRRLHWGKKKEKKNESDSV